MTDLDRLSIPDEPNAIIIIRKSDVASEQSVDETSVKNIILGPDFPETSD
jgi:hypothetical protein